MATPESALGSVEFGSQKTATRPIARHEREPSPSRDYETRGAFGDDEPAAAAPRDDGSYEEAKDDRGAPPADDDEAPPEERPSAFRGRYFGFGHGAPAARDDARTSMVTCAGDDDDERSFDPEADRYSLDSEEFEPPPEDAGVSDRYARGAGGYFGYGRRDAPRVESPDVLRDTASPHEPARFGSPPAYDDEPVGPLDDRARALDELPRPHRFYGEQYESETENPLENCETEEVPSDDEPAPPPRRFGAPAGDRGYGRGYDYRRAEPASRPAYAKIPRPVRAHLHAEPAHRRALSPTVNDPPPRPPRPPPRPRTRAVGL